jgi:hypothetical protein
MEELAPHDVESILTEMQTNSAFDVLSQSIGLSQNETMQLLINCIGGTPRVVEYAVGTLTCDVVQHSHLSAVIDEIGRRISGRYPFLTFELISDALGSAVIPSEKRYKLWLDRSFSLAELITFGFCQDNSQSPARIIIPYAYLFLRRGTPHGTRSEGNC